MKTLIPPYMKHDGTIIPARIIDTLPQKRKESMKYDLLRDFSSRKAELSQRFQQEIYEEQVNLQKSLYELEARYE